MHTSLQYVIAATIMITHLSVQVPSVVIRSLTLTVATRSQLCNCASSTREPSITGKKNAHSSCLIDVSKESSEGEQNMSPPNVPFRPIDCFELKLPKKQCKDTLTLLCPSESRKSISHVKSTLLVPGR